MRLSHIFTYAGGPPPCIDYGLIYNTTAWRTHGVECANFYPDYRLSCWDCEDRDGYSYDPAVTGAQFGTGIYAATIANFSDYLGESTIYLADPDDPTVTITDQPPTAWTNTPAGTIAANASDPGLGVESIEITGAGTTYNSGCLYAGPCPNTMSRSASVASLNLPDGNNTVAVTARDASYYAYRDAAGNIVPGKHQSSASASVKLDREKPRITPTGSLSDARNGFIGPNQDYTLTVTATDGSLSSPATQRAGVTSLSATLDGEALPNASVTTPCSRPEGSCQLSLDTVISAARIDELDDAVPHTVRIRAVDALGQEEIDSFSVRVDKVAPAIYADGNLVELSGRTLTENSYRLRAETRDNQPFAPEVDDDGTSRPVFNLPGAGLRDLVIRLDGQSVNTTRIACIDDEQCEDSRTWDWDASGTPDGPHTITITATDRVGNESVESFEVTMKHQADAPPRTNNDLRRTIKGAALGDRAGSSVSAIGDMNGDGHADYLVGAPGAGGTAGAAYIVLGSDTPGSIDLANPDSSVRKLSGPAAGAYCGTAVGTAGDVNGDGHTDLLVGCPAVDTRLGSLTPTRGKVYVVFGRADVQDVGLGSLDAASNSGFVINGPSDPGTLGLALTQRPAVFGERLQSAPSDDPLPDVNDDGLADIAIGDSAQPRGAENAAGTSYVILGKENGNPVDATALGNAGYVIRGTGTNSLTGYSVAISDDLDGDTLSDVVVGSPAPTSGRVFIVNGNREADVDLAANPAGVIALSSGEQADRFGVNVAALGDTNLDGTADIGIATRAGAFVVRRVPTTDRQISADDGYRVIGPANDPGLLSARIPETPLGAAGDLDGDERRDIIVGFPDVATSRAHTIRSPEASRTLNVAALAGQRGATIAGAPQGDRSGASVGANQYQGAPVTENAQAIVGAPEAQPEPLRLAAGQAVIIAEPTPTGPGVEPDVPDSEVGAAAAQARAAATAPLTPARCGSASAPCHPRGWYKIDVSPDGAWVTARSEPQLFVIGNALRGNFMHVETQARDRSGKKLYDHGRLYGGLQRCAWIATAAVAGPVDNPIAPQQARACGKRRILAPKVFARLINCGLCNDGSPVRLRPQNGGDLPAQIPTYRNVRPGTREGAYSFAGNIKTRRGDRKRSPSSTGATSPRASGLHSCGCPSSTRSGKTPGSSSSASGCQRQDATAYATTATSN